MKEGKEETDTELLARLMAEGFGQVNTRLDGIDTRLDGIDDRLDGIDTRLDGIDGRLDGMDGRLLSLEKIQSQTLSRLDSIERKQDGMLLSLDETAHQRDVEKLSHRVQTLEAIVLPATA